MNYKQQQIKQYEATIKRFQREAKELAIRASRESNVSNKFTLQEHAKQLLLQAGTIRKRIIEIE